MIWLCVQASAFLSFDIVILCLAREFITMVRCVVYIHDSVWPWHFTSRSSLQGLWLFFFFITPISHMALCSGLSFFIFWHSHTLFGMWVYHHGTICHVDSWTLNDLDRWPQYQNYIFTMDISLARCLCSLTLAYQRWFLHETMLCTFLTSVWTLPLTYMWVAGGILSEFYSQLLLFFYASVYRYL